MAVRKRITILGMGAGGLLRGRNKTGKNLGCIINLDKIPTKYEMESYNILVSESQEWMLVISTEDNKNAIQEILKK